MPSRRVESHAAFLERMIDLYRDEAIAHEATIARLRAEVESLRQKVQEARRWGAGLEAKVLSLQAQLAAAVAAIGRHDPTGADHMEEMWVHAQRADQAESDLAAVRTDLSEARRALEDIAREDYRGPRPSGAVKAAAALVLLDQSESAGAGGPLPEA